jgi:hypothetical protein
MKVNKWTLGLAALGLVSLSPAVLAQTAPAAATTPSLLTSLSATTISGYVDTSAVWNPGTGNANPAPYAFNAGKQDGFNLDSMDIKIAKAQDETGWSAGYTAELGFGPDAQGFEAGAYPIRQAFVALHMPVGNGIDWQLGRWDNILGYESNDDYKNPNWTRSYGYSIEPTEHTGLLASYKINDEFSAQAGVADTLTTEGTFLPGVSNPNARSGVGNPAVESKKAVVSMLTFTAPTNWGFMSGSSLSAGFDHGQGAYTHDKTEWYVGLNLNTPIKALTLGASWDAVDHYDVGAGAVAPFVPPTGYPAGADVDAGFIEAFDAYMAYAFTDKLSFNGRFEYANGDLSALTLAEGATPTMGFNKVIAVTGTLQYNLWANVISRLEIRWDHAADGSSPFGGTVVTGPDKKNEVMLAANVIYKF